MRDTLTEDLQIIAESNIRFQKLYGATVLVTGATGLIGSLLVKSLLVCNSVHKLDMKIVALVRNQEKAEKIFQPNDAALGYIIADLEKDEINYEFEIDYIIHAASVTTSKVMVENPVGTINTSIRGTQSVLELAVRKSVKSMLYVSSMEIYGQPHNTHIKTKEIDLGYFDIWNPRSCYPEGKRMCECMCAAYAKQYNLNVKSARLAQTFGPGILENENRVFAYFAKSALKGEAIVLHTPGDSEGNYVYTRDAILAILLILLEGEKAEAYNVSNEESHLTIKEMAELVANKISGDKIKVIIDIPEDGSAKRFPDPVKLWLDNSKIKRLGWKPTVGLAEAYQRMIDWMKFSDWHI